MTRAECYYDILGVNHESTSDDIKKAYRSLALIWHPDKNNTEEAHCKFQSILKAYETLSDSRERDWYDRHKDQILSGNNGNDDKEAANYMDLFPYFSSACYSNYDDSDNGFYTVYRNLFNNLAEEEQTYCTKSSSNKSKSKRNVVVYPEFGKSDSDYDEVVRPFYAFWSSFCTILTFDHLDMYNVTEAENRRIVRAMEKENKKLREPARKERNEKVRNLVEFVKKRDKRVKAYKEKIEQENMIKREKTKEKQRQQREKFLQATSDYKPSSAFENMDDMEEQLRQLEQQYDELEENGD